MQVKIIEQNQARCEELCELLPKATIIHGDATDQELLIEEGLENANAIVALTGMDEENIMMALFGKDKRDQENCCEGQCRYKSTDGREPWN